MAYLILRVGKFCS